MVAPTTTTIERFGRRRWVVYADECGREMRRVATAPACWDCGHESDEHGHGDWRRPCNRIVRHDRGSFPCPCTLYMRDCMGTEVA